MFPHNCVTELPCSCTDGICTPQIAYFVCEATYTSITYDRRTRCLLVASSGSVTKFATSGRFHSYTVPRCLVFLKSAAADSCPHTHTVAVIGRYNLRPQSVAAVPGASQPSSGAAPQAPSYCRHINLNVHVASAIQQFELSLCSSPVRHRRQMGCFFHSHGKLCSPHGLAGNSESAPISIEIHISEESNAQECICRHALHVVRSCELTLRG